MSNQEVGYKNPPKHSQFKKGQSGYPQGRKKGKAQLPDFTKALVGSLSERVMVVVNGKPSKITKFDAGLIQFANKVAKGDVASFKMLIGMQAQLALHSPSQAAAQAESIQAIRARIMKRLDRTREVVKEMEENLARAGKSEDKDAE